MANELGTENEEIDVFGSKGRRRLVLYCVIAYVVLMITVPLCFLYLPSLFDNLPCPIHMSVPLLNPKFHPNGSVEDDGVFYYDSHVFTVNDTTRGCKCQLKPCIRKCCAEDEYHVAVRGLPSKCKKNPKSSPFNNFSLSVHHSPEKSADVPSDHFDILFGDVCTYQKFRLNPKDEHLLMTNGHIFHREKYLDTSKYCLDSKNGSDEIHTYVCFKKDKEADIVFSIYPIFLLFSSIFLIATFLVYSIVPDLRNLHGKSLMCYVASLFVTDVAVSVSHITGSYIPKLPCIMLAFAMQFAFLATFFWMNVMCFDIWWVFSGVRPPRGSAKERDHKKFVLYSVYAWGIPAVILAISLVMDLVPYIPDSFIKPGFGIIKCWFKDNSGALLYFYLPITVIVLLNIIMFVSTACKLQAHSKETKVLRGSESRQNTKAERDRFDLYLKLFVVMGINWVLELVSFFGGGPKSLWFVTDIGNTLQGVLIFLTFVCKRHVMRLVNQKLCLCWALTSASISRPSQSGSSHTQSTLVSKTASNNPSTVPQ